jgi:hypothetical protein
LYDDVQFSRIYLLPSRLPTHCHNNITKQKDFFRES